MDPYINKTPINKIEEKRIFDLHKKLGNKWADIAKDLPGRSDNCIKNYFYSTHRKHQRRINKCLRNAQVGTCPLLFFMLFLSSLSWLLKWIESLNASTNIFKPKSFLTNQRAAPPASAVQLTKFKFDTRLTLLVLFA